MATRYWVGGTGTWDSSSTTKWSTTSGGAGGASAPTTSDDVIFNSSSGSGNANIYSSAACASVTLNISGITLLLQGNVTFPDTSLITHQRGTIDLNNFTLSFGRYSNASSNLTRNINFGSSGVIILTCPTTNTVFNNTVTSGFTASGTSNIRIISAAGSGVTLTIFSPIISRLNFYIPSGTFNLIATNSLFGTLDFTGTYSGSFSIGASSVVTASLIFNSAMSTVSGTTSLTFSGLAITATTAGVVFNFPLSFGSTSACAFQDAVTMASGKAFTLPGTASVKLKAGTINTIDTFVTSGTTLKYLESTTAGSQATISKASGTTTVTYLSIKDSKALGGAWDASDPTNVDGGNNTGWIGFVIPIDVLISESLSLQDASSATQNFISAISEALGLADSSILATTFAIAASEDITLADTPTAGTAFISSILENLVASDTPSSLKTFNVSIAEPQTIQDAANVIAAYITAISEPTTVEESIIGVAAKIITNITEAISVSHAQTAVVSFVSSSVENINVADNETPVRIRYAIVVEPLTLNVEQNVFAWVRVENDTPTSWSLIDNRQ